MIPDIVPVWDAKLSRTILNDGWGGRYLFDGELRQLAYTSNIWEGDVLFMGEWLSTPHPRSWEKDDFNSLIIAGKVVAVNTEGEVRPLNALQTRAIFRSLSTPLVSSVAFPIDNYPTVGVSSLARVDKTTGFSTHILLTDEQSYLRPNTIDDEVYCISRPENKVIKYDKDLKLCWEYAFTGTTPNVIRFVEAINYKDSVIYNLRMSDNHPEPHCRRDGEIVSFAKADGRVLWSRTFAYQVEDCVLLASGRLLVISSGTLYELDAETGEILASVVTGLEARHSGTFLHTLKQYLIVISRRERRLQVYDTVSWQCMREFDAKAEGFNFVRVGHIVDERLVMFVTVGRDNYNSGGCLIIDFNDILAPLEYETEPEMTIIHPSAEQGDLVLEMHHADLGDVLRLVEVIGMIQAAQHGFLAGGTPPKCPEFNGRVVLRYSGCSAPREEAIAKLDILKERFDAFAKEYRHYCGKKKKHVTFHYELL